MRTVDENRRAWDIANRKYVEESDAFLDAADRGTLLALETRLLAPLTRAASVVLHVQSGNGTDDVALSRLSGSTVIGVDFSEIAASAAQARANRLRIPVTYAVGEALRLPVASAQVDLVYTGKGALMWLPDLHAWAVEIARVLRGGGHVFLYEAHPAGALWTLDETSTSVRNDRNYFGGTTTNDSFPASAIQQFSPGSEMKATEWQWTLADIVSALLDAGLQLLHLGEHPEPFWRPGDAVAVHAWAGSLPNAFSLLATKSR